MSRLLIGFDRYVGDHEVGTYWVPFLKHEPTWVLWFHDPAQRHLEIEPLVELSPDEMRQFAEYCAIRYGMHDLEACHAIAVKKVY